jgi:hypothetical protein
MLGSGTARTRRWMTTALVATFVPLLLIASPAAAQDFPPVVSNAHISPASLSSNGGTVTITADVHDDISVFSVEADAYGPGSFLTAPMLLTDLDAGTYTGTIEIGPNFNEDPVYHQIQVVAIDGTSGTTMEYIGDVEVRGNPPFDEKPVVWDPSVVPTSLPVGGGTVNLAVSAWDLRGISEAHATITGPANESRTVSLEPVGGDRFTGVFEAPANTGIFPAYYEIEFAALDDIGQETIVSGERVTVAARPTGVLEITPGDRDFGTVKQGRAARRLIVIRNRAARGTLPIEGLIQTSGAPFFIVGQTAAGVAFKLSPGEAKVYRLVFRPTAPGRFAGQLNVVRSDYGQPFLHVNLTGRGI